MLIKIYRSAIKFPKVLKNLPEYGIIYMSVTSPILRQIKGVLIMTGFLEFLISVGAGITANLICDLFRKLLDGHKK